LPRPERAEASCSCTYRLRQYCNFCTSKASAFVLVKQVRRSLSWTQLLRQYLYFCTSKARKLSTWTCRCRRRQT
jgi:ribosomal protein L24E